MNNVILMGRLTADPEVRYTSGDNSMAVARYTLAVDRRRTAEGKQETDFIRCVAWDKVGEFAERYLKKGMKIAVTGQIRTGSYEKDGVKHYTTDIAVSSHEFCEKRESGATSNNGNVPTGFEPLDDEDIPF